MKYKCKHCGKIVERESTKKWIKSWCETTQKYVHLKKEEKMDNKNLNSQISEVIARLKNQTSSLSGGLNQLREKLTLVLRKKNEEASGKELKETYDVPLAIELGFILEMVEDANFIMMDIFNRLDLNKEE